MDVLPHSIEAERAVLGACLIDPDAIWRCRAMNLRPEQFYRASHATLWRAILAVAAQSEHVDLVTLGDLLESRQNGHGSELDAIGGRGELLALIADTVSTVTVRNHAEIVQRTAGQRGLVAAAGQVAELAFGHQGPLPQLYDAAMARFLSAVNVTEQGSHMTGNDEALLAYVTAQNETEHRLRDNPDALIEVPWVDLGRLLGDLVPGFLHIVAAESSVGKTLYMEAVAEHNARRGHQVAFYHLELSHAYMLHRLVCRYAGGHGVTMQQLRRGYSGSEVAQAMDNVRRWLGNITYIHSPGWSAERIAADMQRLRALGLCDLVIVDYLQKMTLTESKGLNAAMLIGQQAETLKNAAERLEVPVIIGSQVSRANRADHRRPTEGDIRNSGEVAERSNQVVVLHRPVRREDQPKGSATEKIEAYVDKNTGGETGKAELVHVFGRYLLADPVREETEEPWFF
jgi:replicative DNA helicase